MGAGRSDIDIGGGGRRRHQIGRIGGRRRKRRKTKDAAKAPISASTLMGQCETSSTPFQVAATPIAFTAKRRAIAGFTMRVQLARIPHRAATARWNGTSREKQSVPACPRTNQIVVTAIAQRPLRARSNLPCRTPRNATSSTMAAMRGIIADTPTTG